MEEKKNIKNIKIDKNVACCLAIRNCGQYLNKIFKNLDLLSEHFINFYVICVYDNCNDNTEQLLNEYKKKSTFKVLLFHNKNNKSNLRTVRIANSRNICLDIIENTLNIDFHFVIDADNVNILKWDIDLIKYYLNTDDWDCLSFNRKSYYDIWALLYDNYKHHCWGFKNSQAVVNFMRKDIVNKLNKLKDYELYNCLSAFNGFAIYRTNIFNNMRYDGTYLKFKTLVTDKERIITLNKLRTIMNNKLININNYQQHCEHLYYHLSAIKNNNARIRISKKILYLHENY